ncbi:hypothetical protein [Mucilaginibacter psychrotolerans]|uniref:Uncharacterized protein n=1 Tax=Mucilaginibacter psychrotolerans TaxID=1524096 RepID=A0A4Y8S7T6_9SPHI|nr:hypothetical protein [Mucilaginibacter psychrotolerans]TFF34464.1 hypothetical protein E2R66_21880 [Mucilaginibacter psychrotolerans]
MKINKNQVILYGFGILLFIVIDYFARIDDENKFRQFYYTDISGQISKISPHKGAVDITVRGKTFTFSPDFVDNKTDFQFFAKVGDSVSKSAKSDTLKLVRNGKIYSYTFSK